LRCGVYKTALLNLQFAGLAGGAGCRGADALDVVLEHVAS
jgi:hypothetical protein